MSLQDRDKLTAAEAKAHEQFQFLENLLQNNNCKYLATDKPSIADHQVFFQLSDYQIYGLNLDKYPAVLAWYNTCRKAPGINEVHSEWEKNILPVMK